MRLHIAATLLAASTTFAQAPSLQECVSISVEAQQAMKRGALTLARQQLERCVEPSCPQLVRTDCTRWLEEVLASTPSLNVVVRSGGVDQPDAEVLLDGAPWIARITGRPRELDPGEHELTVKREGQQLTRKVLVAEGEKNRLLVFDLPAPVVVERPEEPKPPPPQVIAPPNPTARPPPPVYSGAPTGPLIVSGVALLGALGFAGFGVSGKSRLDALLLKPCAETKTCDPAEVSAIKNEFLAADLSLGLGVASTIGAALWWWWWSAHQPPPDAPKVGLAPGWGSVTLTGAW